jgi:hypothetical protein
VIEELGFKPLRECVIVWIDKVPVQSVNVLDYFEIDPEAN